MSVKIKTEASEGEEVAQESAMQETETVEGNLDSDEGS